MQIAAYVRVSTDDQNEDRQMRAIRQKYSEEEHSNEIDWFCDLGESGASTSRREYQRLREHVAEYDVVVAHELDRLGRSFADLAGFVEDLREKDVDIDLVNQPIGTVGEDDWMAEMMLNMTMVFADAERKMIRSRVQEGIDAAIADGKRIGRPPFGYTVEDGFSSRFPRNTLAPRPSSARCVRAARNTPPLPFLGPPFSGPEHPRTGRGELRCPVRQRPVAARTCEGQRWREVDPKRQANLT